MNSIDYDDSENELYMIWIMKKKMKKKTRFVCVWIWPSSKSPKIEKDTHIVIQLILVKFF